MHPDSAFYIGKTHAVCEDYARVCVRPESNAAFALLSDGCSSSPDTDTGSRFLVHSARAYLSANSVPPAALGRDFFEEIAEHAKWSAIRSKLNPECVDATLAVVSAWRKGSLNYATVQLCGDGAIAVGMDDHVLLYTINFTHSTPYYPSYLVNDSRNAAWNELTEKEGGPGRVIQTAVYIIGGTTMLVSPNPELLTLRDRIFSLDVPPEAKWVCVTSDGLGSFMRQPPEGTAPQEIEIGEAASEAFGFKGFAGSFIQRRFNAYLRNSAKKFIRHDDDLSAAGVYLLGGYLEGEV